MQFQAYIDDSFNHIHRIFVLAGHVASDEAWSSFSVEWEEMLPYGVRRPDGKFHFHMTEMAQNSERLSRVPAFYRLIEKYASMSVSSSVDLNALDRAKNRIWSPGLVIDWGYLNSPYLVAFRALMDVFHQNRNQMREIIPLDQKIDFIFDVQAERPIIDGFWAEYLNQRPKNLRDLYGSKPRFENDMEYLPLQAADLWAWWVRKWTEEGTPEKIENSDFGFWKSNRTDYPKAVMHSTEEDMVRYLISAIREQIGPGRFIYDLKSSHLPIL